MNKQLAGLKFRPRFFAIKEAIMTNSEKKILILKIEH